MANGYFAGVSSPQSQPGVCPRCGAAIAEDAAGWQFCASCGAPLTGARCARCEAPLTPGARFCHRCGLATTATPHKQKSVAELLPWGVAGVALLALFALLAGRGFGSARGAGLDAPQNALPQAGLDFDRPGGGDPAQRASDISQLSPEERADRLFNRVMALASQGKRDSVLFFAPMAISAYRMLGPLNLDQHYDVGRIGEVAGAWPLAQAQSDSILSRAPTHLLGLILAARAATLRGDPEARQRLEQRLVAAERTEATKALPEYERHQNEIVAALAAARRNNR
jgi:hypothetical protein